ncbi:MAG TPA: YHS domain-containing protein, partial [Roseibacterium sp.]|nr:YHS domain-containing protein [Roseibacterium sp.]
GRRMMLNIKIDPVCGMEVPQGKGINTEHAGAIYYFCSDFCLQKFEADPAQYVPSESLIDPVCSMTVTEESAHHTGHEDKTFYFCSASCLAKFSASPEQYLAKDKTEEKSGCCCSSKKNHGT